ncbi:hypothetical protein COV15_02680 [Candidatus Woesearchaeota archaeon CG10_big_fil_rev_8_21_14_0_10_34_12]|nr:MAG: hypothetical protein COV15_02680 [Candidatus Woesearchaeota archaeon CG10_big_fil_rev_8_21_14_0_10_34_12]
MKKEKQNNKTRTVLEIAKSPEKEYNSNNISKVLGITAMGALKILKKLEKEGVLVSRKIGNISVYRVKRDSNYALKYLEFALIYEVEHSNPYVKRWISEIKKIKSEVIAIVFGSVLIKREMAGDIDILFVVKENKFNELIKKIKKINELSEKKIHPVYQSIGDLENNIEKRDKVILNAIKGVVASGYDKISKLLVELR